MSQTQKRWHKAKYGNTERITYSSIKEVFDIPYLIEVQKDSYKSFLDNGIREVFSDFSPIHDTGGKWELAFLDYTLDDSKLKYTVKEAKNRDTTYAIPLKVKTRLTNLETGVSIVQDVFLGDLPLMTDSGSFIINGAERVIVSQLARSPSVYCEVTPDKKGTPRYKTTAIPYRGAWLEFEQDSNDILWVHVDRSRKVTTTTLLRALGWGSDDEIIKLFGGDKMVEITCNKDVNVKTEEQGKLDLFRRLRQGEIPTIEGANKLIENYFFDARRYDLARVGRYKFNKKLSIANRVEGYVAAEDVVSPLTGEVLAEKGARITAEQAVAIQANAVNVVYLVKETGNDGAAFKVIGNNTVNLADFVDFDPKDAGIDEYVYYPALKKILDTGLTGEELKLAIETNVADLIVKHVTRDDIISMVSYNLGLVYGIGSIDNIDHLANRRIRSVGELLQHQFRTGIARLERGIRDRMSTTQPDKEISPQNLINIRPVTSAIREFFGSSQLSQFMDQQNPIAELTHKRKLSALGPGGLSRERAGMPVRDVHHSHYGRMCPIETPEGQNIGLITSLSSYARINEYGFIESPYRKVDKEKGIVTDIVEYLTADVEDKYIVAQANEPLDEEGHFVNERVTCRYIENEYKRGWKEPIDKITEVEASRIDYMDVSPKQLVSIATALIPFLENDDVNRALMGSNMQRQAVPLLRTQAPMIATGVEAKIAFDSGVMLTAKNSGVVKYVDADKIIVKRDDKGEDDVYYTQKFQRSNQSTCFNQRPIVYTGQKVIKDMVLADGPSTDNGELALGKNILVGFMCWEGYNYEDAILISEELVRDDVFTSIHIEEYETEAREITKLGEEQITRDIPNLPDEALRNLDEDGIVRVGAEVHTGDILVGKVTPKGETEMTPEDRLVLAIFGDKAREVRDTSLRVPHGEGGIVVDVKVFTRKNKDELAPGVNKQVRVYIAQKRKISVGDKMAGRHGNKGVISRVLPKEDMPFRADGTPLQIVLNPLGVPSRMNIGQVLEVHLGLVAKLMDWKVCTPVFDGVNEHDISELLAENSLPEDGKIQLYDGRTGEPFENRVTVGYMYMLKLAHLVDDKIHARSVGPYSLVTQQPLGGKAQFGGQRFGEMEVWALEAYGAANVLQEILTVKSDDVVGRVKNYESIVKGNNISEPGIPESFKVLIKELQSLALDVKVLTEERDELFLKDLVEDDFDIPERVRKDDGEEVSLEEFFEKPSSDDLFAGISGSVPKSDMFDDVDADYDTDIFAGFHLTSKDYENESIDTGALFGGSNDDDNE